MSADSLSMSESFALYGYYTTPDGGLTVTEDSDVTVWDEEQPDLEEYECDIDEEDAA